MNGLTLRMSGNGNTVVMRGTIPDVVMIDGVYIHVNELEEMTFECERCGERHLNDNAYDVSANGWTESWCEDCANDYSYECIDCGERVSDDDGRYIEAVDGFVCDSCIENNYTRCEECGDYVPVDNSSYVRSYGRVCEHCLDYSGDFYFCEECEEWVRYDDWDEYEDSCRDCARANSRNNAIIRGYHDAPPLEFIGDLGQSMYNFYGGIEVEVDTKYGETSNVQGALNRIVEIAGDHLHFERDGSLGSYSFEMVTQPHTIEELYALDWRGILGACKENGMSAHDVGTCGLHMHFSRTGFGEDTETQNDNITKLIQFYELYWSDILKVSRRTEAQVADWARRYDRINHRELKSIVNSNGHGSRYHAVNVTNRNTVEIRITRGTLKYETFMACLDFMVTLVKNCVTIDYKDITDPRVWLKGIKSETRDYIQSVGAFANDTNYIECAQ